jgi:hypothetical protein
MPTVTTGLPLIGSMLPNGAIVIASRSDKNIRDNDDDCIVLAMTLNNEFQPYVVWRCRKTDQICFSGDYSRFISDAVKNYEKR